MLSHQVSISTKTKPVMTERRGSPVNRAYNRLYKGTGPVGGGICGGNIKDLPHSMSPINPMTRYWTGKLERKNFMNIYQELNK